AHARRGRGLARTGARNLALKFLQELGALAAYAYWGSRTGPTAVNVLLGIGAPLAMAVVWGTWARRRRRGASRARHASCWS
ncbi:MAG: hypothetical protein QOJ55_1528, partial [Solirubrobacteraceae bacterium]|nr:hypothetical protein [Solirubrobacteraceae bacterium]